MKNISTEKMLEILKEQEKRIIESDKQKVQEEKKLAPKIDIEECLRNGYITADDYRKSHQEHMVLYSNEIKDLFI